MSPKKKKKAYRPPEVTRVRLDREVLLAAACKIGLGVGKATFTCTDTTCKNNTAGS